MKKIWLIAALSVTAIMTAPGVKAQVQVQINIGQQPGWGTVGYDYAPFYYFPDFNFYFDVSSGRYVMFNNGRWDYVNSVPASYHFDPYNAYKVVLKDAHPWTNNNVHQRDYVRYKGMGAKQPVIRDSRDEKYFESRQHPQHAQWEKAHPAQKGNGNNNKGNRPPGQSGKNDGHNGKAPQPNGGQPGGRR
ncbi:MAG: hypothetical protein QM743_07670 [Chitinophagaceae bacterium]